MSSIDHNARPTRYTKADMKRIEDRLREIDEENAADARMMRLCRLAFFAICAALPFALFYALTN